MSHFVEANREQPLLLPPDLHEWVPKDDLAHFVLEAVERVDLRHFRVNKRGSGSRQYPPQMMLALLIYCYVNGIFSSRRIERATYRDLGVRFVAANTHPDSRIMRKIKRFAYQQAYNAQVVVDAEGSYLILGARVSQNASDRNELVADVESIPTEVGTPEEVFADTGYANGTEVAALEAKKVEPFVATGQPG